MSKTRPPFPAASAQTPRTLTLATPRENRHAKRDREAADYQPQFNQC